MGSFKKISVSSAFAVPVAAVCMMTGCASDNLGDAVKMPPHAYVAEEAPAEKAEEAPAIPAPVEEAKEAELAPIAVAEEVTAPAPAPVAEGKVVYTVRQGESLWSIAKVYGLDERTIALENNIAIDKPLTAGDKLIIPDGGKNVDPSTQITLLAPVQKVEKGGTYTVQKGDSLWKIANSCGISVDALAATNSLDPKKPLKVGTVLAIPAGAQVKAIAKKPAKQEAKKAAKEVKKEAAKAEKAEKKAEEATKASEPVKDEAPAAAPASEAETDAIDVSEMETFAIVIDREMDLEEVSRIYERPFGVMRKLNPGIKPGEKLSPGTSVQVPIML